MTIYYGNQQIKNLYIGNVKIKEAYYGSTKVYQSLVGLPIYRFKRYNSSSSSYCYAF